MEERPLEGLNIRPLNMGDLDAIVEIDRKILGKTRSDYWKKKIETPNARYPFSCLVAEYEGKVIGFIVGEVSGWEFGVPDTVGWISTIGVDPVYQHRGVARRLGQEFIKNLKTIGVRVVYTLVNWNDWDLLKFFRGMGFTRGGDMINLELKIE
ncbi:MAG: GNAT family N-acetyltransferase [Syntrophaceae bacterium]|nr:GNAT family N-acetyltransferase [Syntrophaceae bacterium]